MLQRHMNGMLYDCMAYGSTWILWVCVFREILYTHIMENKIIYK